MKEMGVLPFLRAWEKTRGFILLLILFEQKEYKDGEHEKALFHMLLRLRNYHLFLIPSKKLFMYGLWNAYKKAIRP
jgi:hypothetical protein